MGRGTGGEAEAAGVWASAPLIFPEPCVTSTALKYVSALSSGLSVETKCEDPRMSWSFGVSLSFSSLRDREPLRPYSGHYASFLFRLPPNILLCAKGLRACSPTSSELRMVACVPGTLPSPLCMPPARPPFGRAQRVEKSSGRACGLPRHCRGSRHSWSPALWSKPHQ